MSQNEDFDEYDRVFSSWREKHPGSKFSDFSISRIVSGIKKGRAHPTLGSDLAGRNDWRTAGKPFFEMLLRLCDVPVGARICDYGCGSLRVTHHFIRRQDPDCVFGIDVVPHFIDMGKAALGPEILAEKRPKLGVKSRCMAEATEFGADLVYSSLVAQHVHPDEKSEFLDDLRGLSGKDGASLIFDAWLNETPKRFARSGWAWPISYYAERLQPLTLHRAIPASAGAHVGVERQLLVFRRDRP